MQDCFAQYTATKNCAAYDLFEKNLFWVVGEFNIEYVDELPFWSEKITTEIWISEVSKLKIYTDFKLYHDGKIFAKGNACWFILDTETKRPVKTDFISEVFDINDEFVLGEHTKFNLGEFGEKVGEIAHTINVSDLDFNGHVNNKSYVNIAECTATKEFRATHTLEKLNIRFVREAFLNEVLICSAYKCETENTYVHKIERDGVSVCEIKTLWNEKVNNDKIKDYDLKIKKTLAKI